ncbi:DNA-processing protein DprA [Arenimonas terrae]|jgi:DNA processing protein|uniref:DNA-protecting protein DprA n=1 Tax=Arenimonas terrae TaxID=2546226 RepID=A0A5C4RQ09_9GAMM|nr:DNA-processing protein DprA [Arenimonas terrae]TNJ33035.1 DNA-protecting protein DprA [Arenimonas terrae]
MSPDLALLTLSRARLPDALLRQLLDQHPDPAAALAAAGHGAGLDLPAASHAWLRQPDRQRLDADLAWLSRPGRRLLGWHDADYPALLRRSPAAPPLLFVDGDPALLWSAQVGIVGSRRPSAGGHDHARRFARALAGAGWTITSGLAQGIDRAAHEGALDTGRTIAVVGTGLDLAYPPGNAALMARVASNGAVVSEHPPGTGALSTHFPSRNRIIAGLSLGTLVVEAASRSGALITARLAAEAGREVFALPGSIDNPLARGCHRLIRDGAALVEGPEEVVAALAPLALRLAEMLRGQLGDCAATPVYRSADGQSPGDPDHSRLWSALGHDPTGMDVLAERTGLTVAALSSMLLIMELEGHVVNDHGRYARRP